uniref:TNFR-Cys domain-containing protein n=1 Tax=Steinernema glaseri TaxID=37863 RepID=A0A1I7YCS3_9BILA
MATRLEWTFLFLCLVIPLSFYAVVAKNQSCQEFVCSTGNAVASGHAYCNSCGDCGRLKRNFCVQSTNRCECLNSIPDSCTLWQANGSHQGDRHSFCFVATNYLAAPRARHHNRAVEVVVDRFFEEDENLQFKYSDLHLYAEFPVEKAQWCDDEILPTRLINDTRCLLFMRMLMPTVDFHGEPNDPFYYDDQTPMSVSFSTDLLKTSQFVKFWYEVTATWTAHLAQSDQPVSFKFHQYSEMAQLPLNDPDKISKRMDVNAERESSTAPSVQDNSFGGELFGMNSTATVGKLVQAVHNIITGNFTQEAELIATIPAETQSTVNAEATVKPEAAEIPLPTTITVTTSTAEAVLARGHIIRPSAPTYQAPQALEGHEIEDHGPVQTWDVQEAGIHEVFDGYFEEHLYWWVALIVTLLTCCCLVITFFFCVVRNARRDEPQRLSDPEQDPNVRLMGNR